MLNEMRGVYGMIDMDKPWTGVMVTKVHEPCFVLLELGPNQAGNLANMQTWRTIGFVAFGRSGKRLASHVDGLGVDGVELQAWQEYQDAGWPDVEGRSEHVTRLVIARWVRDQLADMGDVELAREYPLQTTLPGCKMVRVGQNMTSWQTDVLPDLWKDAVERAWANEVQ